MLGRVSKAQQCSSRVGVTGGRTDASAGGMTGGDGVILQTLGAAVVVRVEGAARLPPLRHVLGQRGPVGVRHYGRRHPALSGTLTPLSPPQDGWLARTPWPGNRAGRARLMQEPGRAADAGLVGCPLAAQLPGGGVLQGRPKAV